MILFMTLAEVIDIALSLFQKKGLPVTVLGIAIMNYNNGLMLVALSKLAQWLKVRLS